MDNLLSIVIFTPALAGLILAIFLRGDDDLAHRNARWVALFVTTLTFLMSLFILLGFDPADPDFQFVEENDWIFGLQYKLGVDGLNVIFVGLTAFVMPLVIAASWDQAIRVKEFMISLLLLETFVLGALLSLDLVLFFLFLEAAMVPLFLLIGIWGGPGRETASLSAVIVSAVGAVFLLGAMIVMFTEAGTTDIERLMGHQFSTEDVAVLGLDVVGGMQTLLCLAIILGLCVKLPFWPFHAWHPNAMARAPLAAAIMLGAMLALLAGYGLLRIALPILPSGILQLAPLVFTLAGITALYAAIAALTQTDFRKIVAYLSLSQLSIAAMGVFSLTRQGLDGAILLLISQGLVIAGLLICAGILAARQESTQLEAFGGLSIRMPVFSGLMLALIWFGLGLPGGAGFVAFFLTISGLAVAMPWLALAVFISLAILAAALLGAFRKLMRGNLMKERLKSVEDLTWQERATLVPLVAAIICLGIFPSLVLERTGMATQRLVTLFEQERELAWGASPGPQDAARVAIFEAGRAIHGQPVR